MYFLSRYILISLSLRLLGSLTFLYNSFILSKSIVACTNSFHNVCVELLLGVDCTDTSFGWLVCLVALFHSVSVFSTFGLCSLNISSNSSIILSVSVIFNLLLILLILHRYISYFCILHGFYY